MPGDVLHKISPTRTEDLEFHGKNTASFFNGPYLQALSYIVQICFIVIILIKQFDLLRHNLEVPIDYRGDTIFFLAIVKAIIKEGWWWHVRSLSAPSGADLVAMPIIGNLDCLVIKLFAQFTNSVGLLLNLYWFTTIVLAGLISTWCMRRLGVHRLVAFVFGILYAFSPHIYYRHTGHLMLTHHLIPFVATLAVLLAAGRDQSLRRSTLHALIAGCVLLGFSYVYYAFFSCFVLVVGGIIGFLRTRSSRTAGIAALAIALVVLACVANYIPSFRSWISEPGGRTFLTYKSAAEADIYGLKIRDLITPSPRSPIPVFANIAAKVQAAHFPQDNEIRLARLGTIASVGFVLLLAVNFLPRAPHLGPSLELLKALGALTLACVLLGTVGGFGSIFNLLVRPDIRAYNRISIFIVFFSLAGVAVAMTKLLSIASSELWAGAATVVGLAVLLLFGITDQNEAYILNSKRGEDEWKFRLQSEFVRRIEKEVPRNAMIYQLPHLAYGDGDNSAVAHPRVDAPAHEELFVVSNSVRWSWPAISAEDISFARRVEELNASDLVDTLYNRGYQGVYIDSFGYQDDGVKLIKGLSDYLGRSPIQSSDMRYVFFPLLDGKEKDRLDRRTYVWGTPITFSPTGNAARYLGEGWSCVGCTEGKSSSMYFNVPPPLRGATIEAHLTPALFAAIQVRPVRVFVNDLRLGEWEVRQPGWYSISVPRELVQRRSPLFVRFELPNAASPESFGLNSDRRLLSVGFDEMVLLPEGMTFDRPIEVKWGTGSYGEERNQQVTWHWCSAVCEIQLLNSSGTAARVQVTMGIRTGYEEWARFTIVGPSISDSVSVDAVGRQLKYFLNLKPGLNALKMGSNAKPAFAPLDTRNMVFMVTNFAVSSSEGPIK